MSFSIAEILGIAGATSLLLLPGLMVLLALPARLLPPRDLLPAAFVLSPAALAAELAVAALAGMPFSLFAPVASVANAFAAVLLAWLRPRRIALDIPLTWIAPTILIAAPVVVLLVLEPVRRAYGWHNMMQMAAILDVYALPRPPEELEIAGLRLSYGWLGWAQVAAVAKLTEISPTLVFFPLNIAHLALLVYFACEAAVIYSGRRLAMIGVATTLALLCAGLEEILIRFVIPSYRLHEIRITPFVEKFLNMDLMAYAMSSLALMTYALARATQSRDAPAAWLMGVSAGAACLMYPLFLPSCVVIVGAFLALALVAPFVSSWSFPRYRFTEILGIGVVAFASLALPAVYIWFVSKDAATPAAWLNPSLHDLLHAFVRLGSIFCIIDGLLLWIAIVAWRDRAGATLLVAAIAAALQIAYVLIGMPNHVEYKFLFAALIVSAPVIGAWLAAWSERGGLRRAAIATCFAIAASGSALSVSAWQGPSGNAGATMLDEATAEPHPIEGWAESWRRAVRDRTPADAVLLTEFSDEADAVFGMRALYVCDGGQNRKGYSLSCQEELQEVKRYPATVIVGRRAVLEHALTADLTDAESAALLEALAALDRPIVLHTRSPSAFSAWLERKGIGASIFASDTDQVRLIDRGTSSRASR